MSPPKLFAVVLVAAALAVGPATVVATPGVAPTTTAPGVAPTATDAAPGTGNAAANVAGDVAIRLAPRETAVEPGENVTVDVLVAGATTGVDSYSVRVRSSDPGVAPVTDATLPRSDVGRAAIGVDGGSVSFDAAGADLSGDPVTVGTFTVTAGEVGSGSLSIAAVTVGNATADRYRVTERTNASITVTTTPVTVSLDPSTARLGANGTRTVDVVATGATEGVEAFDLTVTSEDAGVAALESGTVAGDPRVRESRAAADGSSVRLLAAGADIADDDGDGSVTLGSVTVAAGEPGDANLTVAVDALGSGTDRYAVASTTGTSVTVANGSGVPPVVGENPPTNVDADPQLEDVDGDGTFTIFDVQAFLANFEGDVVQSNPAAFNFDGSADGEVTIFDVQALLAEL
jgi:hypothetical protein